MSGEELNSGNAVEAEGLGTNETFEAPVLASSSMKMAYSLVERVANTDVPVMILGESGTGKEVVARQLHALSKRRAHAFIKVNCAALPFELLESDLFGHEKGAFTGAISDKPGKFELADRGTIFLDEIGEMDFRLQAKLLQVLQDEEFFRVGGKKNVHVDARVVVATHRDLKKEIEDQRFREDLFYRLNVVAIRLPPLRERIDEVMPLVEYFLRKYQRRYRLEPGPFPEVLRQAFLSSSWPGNVRQLENLVRRWVVLRNEQWVLDELHAAEGRTPHVVVAPAAAGGETSLKEIGKRAAQQAEREAIWAMLQRTAWNKRKAAARLHISYKALLYKIKEGGIVDPRATSEF